MSLSVETTSLVYIGGGPLTVSPHTSNRGSGRLEAPRPAARLLPTLCPLRMHRRTSRSRRSRLRRAMLDRRDAAVLAAQDRDRLYAELLQSRCCGLDRCVLTAPSDLGQRADAESPDCGYEDCCKALRGGHHVSSEQGDPHASRDRRRDRSRDRSRGDGDHTRVLGRCAHDLVVLARERARRVLGNDPRPELQR
jgi:hypothetical protein